MWQFRIDGGFWTPFTDRPVVKLQRSELWVPGWHSIQVRGRVKGLVESLDIDGVTLNVLVDPIAPVVDLTKAARTVTVDASDLVTPVDNLVVKMKVDAGAWQSVTTKLPAELAIPAGAARVTVAVTDEAGHTTEESLDLVGFHGNVPSDGTGCDCRVGAAQGAESQGVGGAIGGGLVALGAAFAVAFGRRRRRFAVLALLLAVTAGLALGGCGSDAGGSGDDDDDGSGDGTEPNGPGGPGGEAAPTPVVPGSIGAWGSIAASDARVVVSAYEEKYGDLVVSDVAADGSFAWRTIDGVPAGPVLGDPNGYRGGVKAKGENVGAFTSIALAGGDARIAYLSLATHGLRFAVETAGVFAKHDVDVPASGEAGRYASLTLDAAGVPAIAYLAWAIDKGNGKFGAELRWAQASTATPGAATDWAISVVDSTEMSCSGLCATGSQCVAATNTCTAVDAAPCPTACEEGFACIGGGCKEVLLAPPAPSYPQGLGLFASTGRLPDGRPVVAYYDRVNGSLLLAIRKADGSWRKVALHADDRSDTGEHASLVVGADGRIHVVYQETVDERLLYRSFKEGANPEMSAVETVDDGERDGDRPHPVGGAASLALDAGGGLVVVYQDGAMADLLVARRGMDGVWSRADVFAGNVGYGFYNGLAATATGLWVYTFGYQAGAVDPGKPFATKLP